jgi:hypothetical protein
MMAISDAVGTKGNKAHRRPITLRGRSKPLHEQRFSSYLVFGFQTTVCMGLFLACYALVLLAVWPLLSTTPQEDAASVTGSEHHLLRQAASKELQTIAKKLHNFEDAHVPGQEKFGAMTDTLKKQLHQMRQGRGVTDAQLLAQAKQEYQVLRQTKLQQRHESLARKANNFGIQKNAPNGVSSIVEADTDAAPVGLGEDPRRGFIVLGMHRSGTSMLAGLLVTSCGYKVGGPLIGGAFDNEKGFFERVDIVLQNDEFMNHQNVWWASNVINYDWKKAVQDYESKAITFKNGMPGLEFLNNPSNAPWLQKDPRMCITLKTWLKLMDNEPAILFTYRHPLEVAMSLKKREQSFTLEHGLRLWILYNMRAIQNSKGLCMVRSSNEAILADPKTQVQRIADELTSKCGVPAPPNWVTQEDVDKFVDPNLQHNKKRRAAEEKAVIAEYNNGKCIVRDFESDTEEGSNEAGREQHLYGIAMKIYCDFDSGAAYNDDYEWPQLD